MYKLTTTVRKALGATPEGMCIGISDYSAQLNNKLKLKNYYKYL